MRKQNKLFMDIETFPALGFFWDSRMYDQQILKVVQPGRIASIAWAWNDGPVKFLALPYKASTLEDRQFAKKLWSLLDKADMVVGHNSKKFDVKRLNTFFKLNGLDPLSTFAQYDTLKETKVHFALPSYKLNDIVEYFGLGKKTPHTGMRLWWECMDGIEPAWRLMKKYNKHDVVLTRKLYEFIRPHSDNHPCLSLIDNRRLCSCGSSHVVKNGIGMKNNTAVQRYRCETCKAPFTGPLIRKRKIEFEVPNG